MVNALENRKMEGIKKYTREELESFVEGIRGAAVKIRELNPGYHIVSLNGGLALFDVLGIVDIDVDSDRAFYFPGSSRIQNSKEVLTRCFENFFLEKQDEVNERCALASLDEVVGGHSVERVVNSYNAASKRVARFNLRGTERRKGDVEDEAYTLRENFPLTIFGIKDMRNTGRRMSREYSSRVDSGDILEFPVKKIITMDDIDYEIVRFAHPESSGFSGQGYYPRVKEITRTSEYNALLRDVAGYVGADPDKIHLDRARIISDCDKYSRKLRYD